MNENNENKECWAINSVIFRKPYDLQLATEEAKKFITSGSKKKPHETKTSYRFRNLNKKKFIKGSFRTKRINKNISLVMGQLKPEHGHLEGAGIFDLFKKPIKAVREFFSPRQGLNNTSTKTLKTYGSGVIDGLTIARTPIESLIDKTLNLISFGKWAQLKKEYKFDELFHLALIVKIGNKNIIVEKNEVINISTSYKMSSKTETLDVPLNGKKITLDQLIDNTKNFMGKDFIPYDGFKNNCQFFIRAVLQSNGLYGESEKNFLFQDLEELSKKMPWLTKKIMNLTTHTGAVVNKIMGKGEPKEEEFSLNSFTLKQLKQLVEIYNEFINIDNVDKASKKELVEELEKHLYINDEGLNLKEHSFDIVKKNKKGSEIEVEEERIKSELEKINKEYLPIKKAKEDSEAKIKAEYIEKYGYPDLMKFHRQLKSGVLTVEDNKYKELKKKFGVKTKKELMEYLQDHSFENFERFHSLYKYEGKDKYNLLYKQQHKLTVGSNPEKIKKRLDMEKKLKELKDIESRQKAIVSKINEDSKNKFGEDLDELNRQFNYFTYNAKLLSKEDKEKKVKMQKDLKKKFKIRTNDLLEEFIRNNMPSITKYKNEEYNELYEQAHELWKELTNIPDSPYYGSNQYYGYGKKDLDDEFRMDEADHEKKLTEFEKSMPSQETIKDVLKALKHMNNSGLNHINKLEKLINK